MSSVHDRSIEPIYLTTTDQGEVNISTENYATLSLSFAGTITTGTFTVEGSNDGTEWEEVAIAKNNNQVPDNEIAETGTFVVGVTSYSLVKIVPDSFTGNVRITPNLTTRITPPFTVGIV